MEGNGWKMPSVVLRVDCVTTRGGAAVGNWMETGGKKVAGVGRKGSKGVGWTGTMGLG